MTGFLYETLIDDSFCIQTIISRTKEVNGIICESGTDDQVAPW